VSHCCGPPHRTTTIERSSVGSANGAIDRYSSRVPLSPPALAVEVTAGRRWHC